MTEDEKKEMLRLIEGLRADLGKAVEVTTRVDKLEKSLTERETKAADVQKEIESIRSDLKERESTITDLQRKVREQRIGSDPLREKRDAIAMYGMIARRALAAHLRCEVPSRFSAEREIVESYQKQRATVQESTGAGTYFIPTILENEIMDTLEQVSDILSLVDMKTGMPTKGTIPTLTSRPSLQPKRASSDTALTQTDFGFSQTSFDTEEASLFFPVDNWLMELSPVALGQMMIPLTRDAFIDGLAKWLILADGTANYNSITGILAESTYTTSMASGKTSFGSVDNAQLNKVLAAMLKRGRANAVFVMSLYVQGILEDISREGKIPIITADLVNGNYKCKSRPIIIDESMPDEADEAVSTAFMGVGDLASYLVVLAGNGIRVDVSKEYLFGKNQTAFRALGHVDIVRKPVNTFRTLKTAAE